MRIAITGRVARPERSDGRGESRADSAIAFVCRGCHFERLGAAPRAYQGVPPGPTYAAVAEALNCLVLGKELDKKRKSA
jgi:hypothetical protein